MGALRGPARGVLKRALEHARNPGFSFFCAPDIEYFYFDGTDELGRPVPLDQGSYFDLTTGDIGTEPAAGRTVLTLEDMGIPVEYSQHEDAPSQHEIDLRYTDALTMADTVMMCVRMAT